MIHRAGKWWISYCIGNIPGNGKHSSILQIMPELTAHFDKQNKFSKRLTKLALFLHVQPSGLTETAGTDYLWSIAYTLSVRFTPCELLCLEIWFLLCLGVHSGEAEINSSQKSFEINLEILSESFVWLCNKLYESSRRKPGWRFTAGFEYWSTTSFQLAVSKTWRP